MKKYPKYKNSGIAWLGEIPEHWEQSKLKSIGFLFGGLSGKSGKDFKKENHPDNRNYIPFTNIANNSYVDNNQLDTVIFYDDEKQNQVIKNDILFLMSSENFEDIGKTALVKNDIDEVYLNSFCKGFRITNDNINSNFLNYLLVADINRKQLIIEARGFTRINLKIQKVKDLTFYYPLSKQEQTAIANFLDYKLEKIDRFITKKKQLIELLNEQKAAIINQAVTKGVNPNAKMKPSGIEWLSDIPEGWVQTKLKSIGFLYGGLSGKSGKDFKIDNHPNNKYYIPFTNIANNSIINNNQLDTFIFNKNEKQNEVLKNDLLFLMSSETYDDIGKTALMKYDIDEVYLNSFCKGFRIVDKNINASFLNFLLMANINRKQLIIEARGFTRINLKIQKVKDLTFFYPNSTKEQIEIVDFIQTETTKIEKTISTIAKEIALVEEYKTALISEAVTGKIDVREFEVPQVEIPLAMVAEEATSYNKE